MFSKNSFAFSTVAIALTLSVIIFVLSFCTLSTTAAEVNELKTITSVNLRESASSSASVLTSIPDNTAVVLLSNSSKGWAKVKYSTYTGYCSTAYLQPTADSLVTMTGRTSADVNMRSGKGTSYDVIDVIPDDTKVTVLSNASENWAKVKYNGETGYVSKNYITITLYVAKTTSTESTVAPTTAPTSTEDGYKNPSVLNLPHWYGYSITDSLLGEGDFAFSKLMVNKSSVSLDVNEKFSLTAFVTGATPVLNHVSFVSSDTSVATISQTGLINGVKSGQATITATDLVSGKSAKCAVSVSTNVLPTEAPTQVVTVAPTVAPTQAPTVAPTEKPTQAPTVKPTQAPTQAPTTKPTVADDKITLSESEARLYVGTQHILKAKSNSTVTWTTSNSSVATVSNGVVTLKSAGTAVITAKNSSSSAKCTFTAVEQKISINASHSSATVVAGKTFFARSTTSDVTWSSSDTSVATVSNGFILGKAEGQAIIKIYKKGGTKTILVTVTPAAPIRFAYTSPNCAPKNSSVDLIAITDSTRTDVRFKVTVDSKTETVYATSKEKDGSNYIWKASYEFTTAGTHNVKAYSKLGSSWSTCGDGSTTAFVTSTTSKKTTVCAPRRASDEIINMIATFEGYMPSVYEDVLTGDPTLGYGKLVFVGEQFYNSLTKPEAYAYLSQTINNDGYSSKVSSFLVDNSIKFNQQQFDALVCFVYNTGTGVLSNDDEIRNALLDCPSESSGSTKTYYINGSAVRIRKGPGTSYDIIKELSYGTTLTILEKTNSYWYYVQLSDGTKGYVATDYIASKTTSDVLDLTYVKKQNFINKFCQYHHANGCIRGLLNRRIDEMEVFFYNDYDVDYGSNNYNIKFTCASNSNFHT